MTKRELREQRLKAKGKDFIYDTIRPGIIEYSVQVLGQRSTYYHHWGEAFLGAPRYLGRRSPETEYMKPAACIKAILDIADHDTDTAIWLDRELGLPIEKEITAGQLRRNGIRSWLAVGTSVAATAVAVIALVQGCSTQAQPPQPPTASAPAPPTR